MFRTRYQYVVVDSPRPNELMIRQFNRRTSFNVTYIPLIRKNIRLVAACTFEIPSKRGFQDLIIITCLEYSPAIGMQSWLSIVNLAINQFVPQRPGD